MTATTKPYAGSTRTGMRGLGVLTRTEGRLFLRDFGSLFFVLIFPSVLLIGMGLAIPGMREPITDAGPLWGQFTVVDLFLPVMLCVAAATAGLTALPAYLASYRETGVLRRLSTTPMRPQGVLLAQLVVQLVAVTVGALLALLAGRLVFGSPMPERPVLAVVTFLLAVTAMFGIGLLIGGVANKGTTASGIGMLVYFPMLFLAGLWTPGPAMPDAVARVATYTPLGAGSQAMNVAWFGDGDFPLTQLVVMVVWSVLLFLVAARTFRWE